jgi:hypothetical protein
MLFSALLFHVLVLQNPIFFIIHPLCPLRKGLPLKALACQALFVDVKRATH